MDARLAAGLFLIGIPALCSAIIFGGLMLSLKRRKERKT